MTVFTALSLVAALAASSGASPSVSARLDTARDAQDKAALERLAAEYAQAARKNVDDAGAQYQLALAKSYLAEVDLELKDKNGAKDAAEEGIQAAERAVSLNSAVAEHHRVLGTLCGQVIPANPWLAMKYGRCAVDSINKAIELDGKSALAYLSRGVGNYYAPPALGGGLDKALSDFRKALELDPKLADAHMWMGLALRKSNKNAEARAELGKALALNPRRVWVQQQLQKTPAQ